MNKKWTHKFALAGTVLALAAAAAPAAALAKHGADDPVGHVRGGLVDNPAGHVRGGADDGPNHR